MQLRDTILTVLNAALELDREAISELAETRVPCKEKLDEVLVTYSKNHDLSGPYFIGFMGIINGILLENGEPVIYSVLASPENKIIIEFK